ncbi:hypothetical protein [Xylanibacillus composti]|nr:hypothetical protein [Xylanibacillus composti]
MQDTQEHRGPLSDRIMITIHMISGDVFEQPLPYEMADGVQDFLDWYRDPGKERIWTWHVPSQMSVHAFHHAHIVAVDVDGYIEPDGRNSRWWERLWEKWLVRRWL